MDTTGQQGQSQILGKSDSASHVKEEIQQAGWGEIIFRALLVITLLYLFLVGVKVLGSSFKLLGSDFTTGLLNVSANPVVGLLAGILATTLVQSSSVSTSIIVGLVSSGGLSLTGAVPMVMGANIGTSVTNTIVSMGYVRNDKSFKSAFAAATVHDFFNILTVLTLLPLEMTTGFISKASSYFAHSLYGASSAAFGFSSPVKAALKPTVGGIKSFVVDFLGFNSWIGGALLIAIAAALIIFALSQIVRIMSALVESRTGDIVDRILRKNAFFSMGLGVVITVLVQSSSITTSLMIPLAGAGLLSLPAILPVTLGANIGTTLTALLASLTGNVAGLAIALAHLIFNIGGILIWFPFEPLRRIPLRCSELLSEAVAHKKHYGIFYIIAIFFLLPLGAVLLFK
jgi:sodium-dependent phosphate cotransporter